MDEMRQQQAKDDQPVAPETEEQGQDADTEGQSMLVYELGLNVAGERRREAERAARDSGRLARQGRRGLLDRIRRR